ncbi:MULTISPECIES: outer membrane beta-barrel protein [Rhodopseudomonas]|uniref:Membrane protein n=1 Tax=Rhodopseudomonas palustris TaxID=1076 RepID=A0A0D7F3I1_RHOPL|nr:MULTISPECIES: outer membrane beta-barrel protein [Rhodopseudomonas]KIZ47330.1 membrane protein [Rhodopseudomonas palustris]MDF3812890.1 outer membrane beta-barrel protein [Rhodopseudomonas sp. BAL398]WOK18994.1 outer membrane beta-barrel protein [Rhodopseudomonas sp. BAL398]
MKKFLMGTAGLIALSAAAAPAVAADLPARTYTKAPAYVAPIYDWSGFYIGANGGWGTTHDKWSTIGGFDLGSHDADGGIAGGQIGYRWQTGTWVFGLEAQGDWADLSGSHNNLVVAPPFFPFQLSDNSKLKAFGLFTGQIGYAWDNALLYAKGGAAITSTKYDVSLPVLGIVAATDDVERWGATVGAGVEYGFAPNWSMAVEYDHIFMGRKDVDFYLTSTGTFAGVAHTGGDTDMVTARVNYRWGGPIVGRY